MLRERPHLPHRRPNDCAQLRARPVTSSALRPQALKDATPTNGPVELFSGTFRRPDDLYTDVVLARALTIHSGRDSSGPNVFPSVKVTGIALACRRANAIGIDSQRLNRDYSTADPKPGNSRRPLDGNSTIIRRPVCKMHVTPNVVSRLSTHSASGRTGGERLEWKVFR